jgi:hypothetical protein
VFFIYNYRSLLAIGNVGLLTIGNGANSPNISIYIFLSENITFTEHKYLYIHFRMVTNVYISNYRTTITLGVFIELQLLPFPIIAYREERKGSLCYRQWGRGIETNRGMYLFQNLRMAKCIRY